MILFGALFMLQGCGGDDHGRANCNVDEYEEGCSDGVYLRCEFDRDSRNGLGHVVEHATVTIDGVVYKCNGNERVPETVVSDIQCANGLFAENHSHFSIVADQLLACNGNESVNVTAEYNSACEGTKRYYYDVDANRYKVEDCADAARICEEYPKGNQIYAACVNASDVADGCGAVNFYGNCDGNTLVICSSRDNSQGKTLRIDCGAQSASKICVFVNDSYGYDCAVKCSDPDNQSTIYNDYGICEDKLLRYCTQSGQYAEAYCENTCGFNGSYYDCLWHSVMTQQPMAKWFVW